MTLKGQYLLCFSMLLGLLSCNAGLDEKTIEEIVPDPEVYINADLRGLVVDEDGIAIAGANVKFQNLEGVTDEFGYFLFTSANLPINGSLVNIEKDGYFEGSRFVFASFKDNFVKIRLITKALSGLINASIGDTLELNNQAKVIFPANAFQDKNENHYNGSVKVYAHWLNPDGTKLGTFMPSNLLGSNLQGEKVSLASLGMAKLEMVSSSDEILTIKDNMTVLMHFPLPEAYQATAPPILPLWSLTLNDNIWKQEGLARLTNNVYETEVSHSGWWNCAWSYAQIGFEGQVLYEMDSLPLMEKKINIRLVDRNWNSTIIHSNKEGEFNAVVPAQSKLKIECFNDADELIYINEIGPFSEKQDIGELFIN